MAANDGRRVTALEERIEHMALGFVATRYGLEADELSALADLKRAASAARPTWPLAEFLRIAAELIDNDPNILEREEKVHRIYRQLGINPVVATRAVNEAWDALDPASITTLADIVAREAEIWRRSVAESEAARAENEAQAQAERAG